MAKIHRYELTVTWIDNLGDSRTDRTIIGKVIVAQARLAPAVVRRNDHET